MPPRRPCCRRCGGVTPIWRPGCCGSTGRRSRHGCPNRCGRWRRPERWCRRASPTRRARNKASACRPAFTSGPIAAGSSPAWRGCSDPRGRRRQATRSERPRRMGTCDEVADGGEQSGGPPRLRTATQAARPRFSDRIGSLPNSPGAALNLFGFAQTYSCLGHCITRGIGLRRQATILRLSGATLFEARDGSLSARPPRIPNSQPRPAIPRLFTQAGLLYKFAASSRIRKGAFS
jgi:hypothetical protein